MPRAVPDLAFYAVGAYILISTIYQLRSLYEGRLRDAVLLIVDAPPRFYGLIYVLLVPIFAAIYLLLPSNVISQDLTWLDSFYFSMTTLTTLGLGDIRPTGSVARFVVASQAALGVLLIGLYLSSLANSSQRRDTLRRAEDTLRTNFVLTSLAIENYVEHAAMVSSPISDRRYTWDSSFIFADMRDLHKPTLLLKHSPNSSCVEVYFAAESSMLDSVSQLIRSVDLNHWPALADACAEIVKLGFFTDWSGPIVEASVKSDKALMKMVEKMIGETEGEPELIASNLINAYVMLYWRLKAMVPMLDVLSKEVAIALSEN